jgi:dTDP-4-amino-4,6-dideoxygalactose transaminase
MSVPLLDLRAQNELVRQEIVEGLQDLMNRSSFILGSHVSEFEKEVAAYAHTHYAVGVSSGTDAQLLALMALGVGPGDEVIIPTFTFFSTAGVVARLGATPVFTDIDPATFNMDPSSLATCLSSKTKAIMPVHLFGQLADMPAIMKMANALQVPVVEDACQSMGARGWGREAGEWGSMSSFSFYPTKNLGAFGDAGLTTILEDESLYKKVKRLRVHGMEPVYVHHEVGINGRLDEFQAMVLRSKLKHLESWHEGRIRNATWYLARLAHLDVDRVELPSFKIPEGRHIYNQFTLKIKKGQRDAFRAHLNKHEIGNAVYYPMCLHEQPCFAYLGKTQGQFVQSELAASEVVSIPVYPEMTLQQLEEVADVIESFFR